MLQSCCGAGGGESYQWPGAQHAQQLRVTPWSMFQSTFLDVYPDELLWTREQWAREFSFIKAAGISEVIVAGAVLVGPDNSIPAGAVFYNSTAVKDFPLLMGLDAKPLVLPRIMAAARLNNVSVAF